MRGIFENPDDILRFECDETKETLKQALAKVKSDDTVHKYHNHGEAINEKSTYDKAKGEILRGENETAVSQTQTFASMLMNGAEGSRLTLDKQSGKTETTGEIILNTINTDNDDGIDMAELISYLNAVQKEAGSVKNKTGARKFAGGINLDIKDLVNIGKVFKKYAGNDGKLQASELQNLLNDLKQKSMSQLAPQDVDKYIEKPEKKIPQPQDKKPKPPAPAPQREEVTLRDGNRTRIVGTTEQEYYYKNNKRTLLNEAEVDSLAEPGKKIKVTIEDNNGNIAVVKNPLFGKKKFVRIQDLEKEVNAKVQQKTVDNEDNKQIVKVKDKNNEVSYYSIITNADGTFKLCEELIEVKKDQFVTASKAIKKELGLPDDALLPENITAEYNKDGKMEFKLNGGKCSTNIAKVYIIRYNSQMKKDMPDNVQTLDLNPGIRPHLYNTPVELKDNEKKFVQTEAAKLGLKETNAGDYGWFYSEKEKTHYKWNPEKQKFVKETNIRKIESDGTPVFSQIDLDDKNIYQEAANKNETMMWNLYLKSGKDTISKIITNYNKENPKQGYFEAITDINEFPDNDLENVIELLEENSFYEDKQFIQLETIYNEKVNKKDAELSKKDIEEIDKLVNSLIEKLNKLKQKQTKGQNKEFSTSLYFNPVKLEKSDKAKADEAAKAQGFTPSFGAEYGWYRDKDNNHYFWNSSTEKFIKQENISFVSKDGAVTLKHIDINNKELFKLAAQGNNSAIDNILYDADESNISDIIRAFNKQNPKNGILVSVYYTTSKDAGDCKDMLKLFLDNAQMYGLENEEEYKKLTDIFKSDESKITINELKQADTLINKLNKKLIKNKEKNDKQADSSVYYNPVKIKDEEKTEMKEAAEAQGLKETKASDFGWYSKNDVFYLWNKNKFIRHDNVFLVFSDGSVSTEEIDLTDKNMFNAAKNENEMAIDDIISNTNESNISNIIKAFNKRHPKNGIITTIFNSYADTSIGYRTKECKEMIRHFLNSAKANGFEKEKEYEQLSNIAKLKEFNAEILKEADRIINQLNKKIQAK